MTVRRTMLLAILVMAAAWALWPGVPDDAGEPAADGTSELAPTEVRAATRAG